MKTVEKGAWALDSYFEWIRGYIRISEFFNPSLHTLNLFIESVTY